MLPEIKTLGRVVVCEDDDITRELLCENLAADRFEPLPAPSASDALRHCRYSNPDLMVLDLALPDAGGLDVLREIRTAGDGAPIYDADLPVVIITGRGADADRVRGITEGADDYLVKPFHYPELLARMRNLLRRRSGGRRGPIRIGPLSVDSATREVHLGERKVELANREFELLQALAAEPRRVFTKQELLRDVWGFESLGRTRTLDSHASRLRRKLDPENGRYVINCWGVGYRLLEG